MFSDGLSIRLWKADLHLSHGKKLWFNLFCLYTCSIITTTWYFLKDGTMQETVYETVTREMHGCFCPWGQVILLIKVLYVCANNWSTIKCKGDIVFLGNLYIYHYILYVYIPASLGSGWVVIRFILQSKCLPVHSLILPWTELFQVNPHILCFVSGTPTFGYLTSHFTISICETRGAKMDGICEYELYT